MAGDWIKMRTDLYKDPKVILISDFLLGMESDLSRYVNQNCQRDMCVTRNVMRNATVGALVSVWGVARHQGKRIDDDLLIKNVTNSVIDDIAEIAGFGAAMESVNWIKSTSHGVVFPAFFKANNVDPSTDAKAKNAERQRRYRETKRNGESNATRNVTVTSQSNDRVEKSRVEKSINSVSGGARNLNIPNPLDVPEFETAWRLYCDWWLSETGKQLDAIKGQFQLESLCRSPGKAVADLKLTMEKARQPGAIWDSSRPSPANSASGDKQNRRANLKRKIQEAGRNQ